MATQLRPLIVMVQSQEFQTGIKEGRGNSQRHPRFNIDGCVTEAGVLEIVGNMLYMYADHELSDEQLQHDCGLIVGWTIRACQESRV